MNVVDSSGWLEYFRDGPNAASFAPAIEETETLLVPTICLYEVLKRFWVEELPTDGLRAVSAMRQGRVIDIDQRIAVEAAQFSATTKIPMADSLIYTVARLHGATLWTQDIDLEGLDGVRYFRYQK